MTELDLEGRDSISFTVSGEWAHFRRIDTTTDKQTYRVIPRTTLAGLIGAILGLPRDSYYHLFAPDSSAIAIEVVNPVRTMPVPMLTIPTKEGDIVTAEGTTGKTVVSPERLESSRQRRTFEYLRDVSYRVHVILDDDEVRTDLAERLGADGGPVRSVYTPSLGKTECLAEIENVRRETVQEAPESDSIDSTIPEDRLRVDAGASYAFERTPAYMTANDTGRKTTGFVSYAFPTDGEPLTVSGVDGYQVGDSTVCFF